MRFGCYLTVTNLDSHSNILLQSGSKTDTVIDSIRYRLVPVSASININPAMRATAYVYPTQCSRRDDRAAFERPVTRPLLARHSNGMRYKRSSPIILYYVLNALICLTAVNV